MNPAEKHDAPAINELEWWPLLPNGPGSLWWGRAFPTVPCDSLKYGESSPWWTLRRCRELTAWLASGSVRELVAILCNRDRWKPYAEARARSRLFAAAWIKRDVERLSSPGSGADRGGKGIICASIRPWMIGLGPEDAIKVATGVRRIEALAELIAAGVGEERRILRSDFAMRNILDSGLMDHISARAGRALVPPAIERRDQMEAERIGAEAFGANN